MTLSKDKAIKILSRYDSEHYTPATRQAHRMGAEALAVGDKWVSTAERLPDIFGVFLVAVRDAHGRRYTDGADFDLSQKRWRTMLYLSPEDTVTHWMPLPEPPKEERQCR